jgi:hypothetical protein
MRRKAKVPKVRACCKYGCCVHPGKWEDFYNIVKLKQVNVQKEFSLYE